MNKLETTRIMAVLQAAYPQFYTKKTMDELNAIANLWTEMFSDEPYELVAMATKALIKTRTSTFPPGIGEINEKIMQITTPEDMSAMEAWACVAKAIRNGLYGAEKEFNSLDSIIQKIVGSPQQLREWAMMDSDTVNSVIASNFRQSYNARVKNEREYIALPSAVKAFMAHLSDGMDMKKITGGSKDETQAGEPL